MKPSEWIMRASAEKALLQHRKEDALDLLGAIISYLDQQYANHGNGQSPKEDS